jgi:hypothetical protein
METNNFICQRCKEKEANVNCSECLCFKVICESCDTYIHGLPSKINHKRELINKINDRYCKPNTEIQELEDIDTYSTKRDNQYCNFQYNIDTNNSNNNIIHSLPSEQFRTTNNSYMHQSTDKQYNITNYNQDSYYQKTEDNYKVYTPLIQNQYSRDYVTELKSIFIKEKNDLIFKNTTLQNTLDKLKNSFTEQILGLTNQIEQSNLRNNSALKALEDNLDSYYKTIILEKDTEIDDLKKQNKILSEANRNNNDRLNKALIETDDLKSNITYKENYYNNKLNEKDREIDNLKQYNSSNKHSFEEKLSNNETKLKEYYEGQLRKLEDILDSNEKYFNSTMENNEKTIKNISTNSKETENKLNNKINELKEEIDSHKQNLICYRDRRLEIEKEIQGCKMIIDSLKKENKLLNNEIKLIDNNLKQYQRENDELKIELTRLDKLVYGKGKITNANNSKFIVK